MKKLAVSVVVIYNIISAIVSYLVNRLQLAFDSVRIHSIEGMKFQLDFGMVLSRMPTIPFVFIRFSDLKLLTLDGGGICSVQLAHSIQLNSLEVSCKNSKCTILNNVLFDEFGANLLFEKSVTFQMSGYVNLLLFNLIPLLPFSFIRFKKVCTIPALDRLSKFGITEVDVKAGTSETLLLACTVVIYSHSIVALDLASSVSLDMFYRQEYVGYTTIDNFHLDQGKTVLQGTCYMIKNIHTPEIMTKYMGSQNLVFDIKGSPNSTNIAALKHAISQMEMSTRLPDLDAELITTAYLSLLSTNPLTLTTSSFMDVYNPFEAPIIILGISGSVKLSDQDIGRIQYEDENSPIVVHPKVISTTKQLPLSLKVNLISLNALAQLGINQQLRVDVDAVLRCKIGEFETEVHYKQESVNVVIN